MSGNENGWTAPGASQQAWATPGTPTPEATAGTGSVPPPPPPVGSPVVPGTQQTAVPQLAYRPGIVPLRPLTMTEIWSGVFTAIRGNPAATIGLALVTTLAVLAPLTVAGVWLTATMAGSTSSMGMVEGSEVDVFLAELGSALPGFSIYVTALLLPLFIAVVIGQGVQGRTVGMGETWRVARRRILAALGTVLTQGLLFVVGSALLVFVVVIVAQTAPTAVAVTVGIAAGLLAIAAWVLLSVRWAFATTAVVLENLSPWKALARSWRLSRKRGFWRVFGIRLLTNIVTAIVMWMVSLPVLFVLFFVASGVSGASGDPAGSPLWMMPVIQGVLTLVQAVPFAPFIAGVDSLLYVDQRIRYEGLDVQLLQQPPTPAVS